MVARILAGFGRPAEPRTFPALCAANLPRMRGQVEILRDGHGLPHIYAEEEADLYAALGYLQAADRFFFIDTIRHLGAGRLCELIGNWRAPKRSDLLAGRCIADVDSFIRPLAFDAQSHQDFSHLDGQAARCLEAFADGVNAALAAMRGTYPPEYLFAGTVRPWHPADSLLAGRACAFVISLTAFENELTFDAVRGAVGDAVARHVYPDAPWDCAPTSYAASGPVPAPEVPLHIEGGGSNNWAVAPARAHNRAPMVANDPHVPLFPLPTFWYHVHVECPAYRVQGGIFPGCPVFGFGHNGALAWGCTTGFRDGYDMYRIHRLPDDRTRYRTVDGSDVIRRHREELMTRRGRRIRLEWESCGHGILYPGWKHHDGVDLAVRVVPSDLAAYFEGYRALAASRTVDEHRRALQRINDGPFDFNHVYGHVDGHIGWELFGRLPRRRSEGLFVRDAQDPSAQWDGFVPFTEMPKLLNPARGFVASANSTTDPLQHAIAFTSTHCEPPYRQARIEAVLDAQAVHTADTFAALQRDVVAEYAAAVRDVLVPMIGTVTGNDVAAQALDCVRTWDGTFPSDSRGALVYARLMPALATRTFEPLLGPRVGTRFARGRRALPRLHRLLLEEADPLRDEVERAAGMAFNEIVRAAFFAVVNDISRQLGPRPSRWRWGDVQRAWLGTALGLVPRLGRHFVALEGEFPGDEYTVSPCRPVAFKGRLYAFVGASSRFICDLSKPDEALFAHSAGASADPRSTFFRNLTTGWYRFEYFRSALWRPHEVPHPAEHLVICAGGSR